MVNAFDRTRLLIGAEAMEQLAQSRVAVFGIGGVGGYAVEALARSGVGALDLIDNDEVSLTNLNRQLIATRKTLGRPKVDVARERILDINPECRVTVHRVFYLPETKDQFDFSSYDYVVDAIDTVTGKLSLIEQAKAAGTPIISAMGAGNKLDPTALRVADIEQTSVCPLARVIRGECRKRGIRKLKVVYSTELPIRPTENADTVRRRESGGEAPKTRKDVPGSTAFVPSVMGLIIGGEVVKDLIRNGNRKNPGQPDEKPEERKETGKMAYNFYGWEQATVPAVDESYAGIHTPQDLYDALSHVWCEETCAPRMRPDWSESNRTLGQCSITSFLIQDIFGGKVFGVPLKEGGVHCYNAVGDSVFDLTSEQFGDEKLCYENNAEQTREEHFASEEKYQRYLLLKDRLAAYCRERQA